MADIRVVLCDIEGTTSSISFVHKVLFPLSLKKMEGYLSANSIKEDIKSHLDVLWKKIQPADANHREKILLQTLEGYIKSDVKDTTLKYIQGKIWHEAFLAGEVKGHVYPEVASFFQKWSSHSKKIFIYSSGSIQAQKDLFQHSQAGDLSVYLSGYFDTTTGMKRDALSYRKIQNAIGVDAAAILFLSDVVEELNAAREADMQTCLLLREGASAPESYDGAKALDFAVVDSLFF
ncbi:MAG TPA: acireductone synthase [Turneriella sp.]|nr:acireductone synthase [Turneriella sp.]